MKKAFVNIMRKPYVYVLFLSALIVSGKSFYPSMRNHILGTWIPYVLAVSGIMLPYRDSIRGMGKDSGAPIANKWVSAASVAISFLFIMLLVISAAFLIF
jgi:hypothetical protein